ncbi:hypothetical protein QCA50_019825 [Cerrena zonata]|uniref:Multidrug resistance-associated ABC transporter n=1 Tax=Cerrena zonata TaxID=2478898 RepID=A0AAW0FA76_9APHY
MTVCHGASLVSLSEPCVRQFWASIVPAVLVAIFCVFRIPVPSQAKGVLRLVQAPFKNFLPLAEAEFLDNGVIVVEAEAPHQSVWRSLLISSFSLLETLLWLGLGSYALAVDPSSSWNYVLPWILAASWFYAVLRTTLKPTSTPPFDLFVLYTLHLIFSLVSIGGIIYDTYISGNSAPTIWVLVGQGANLLVVSFLLIAVLQMPLAIPSKHIDPAEIGKSISLEDYTSLWGWITFNWVMPLVRKGTRTTLNESDVWNLSPTMQARPVYIKFSQTHRKTLLRRLWAANSLDLLLDFGLTYVSVVFNYLGPFFLKKILDSLNQDKIKEDKELVYQAYIYAFLAFVSTICKAEADVQHLWYGRRASTRIRSELMSAIYDKALKRKDFSGIVDKDAAKDAKTPSKPNTDPKADEPKAGADIGKIVNLMAGDANRVCMMVSGAYFIYGAPFEIIIACLFLYQLLGIAAFAGFFIILVIWPLNNFFARRSFRIHKGLSTARDKRMGVLNELISAIKFIKFFAWEDKWVQRTLDAREVEMQWMIKARINSICLSFVWSTAPILVSLSSFFVYIWQGKELTVGIAFTSIALFQMIRAPLNVIPAWIVQILQTGVAINRISTYLGEDEVDEQVSTLKKRSAPSDSDEVGLGIKNGSFKWNEVEETQDNKTQKNGASSQPASSSDETDTAVETASSIGENTDHRFELRDITVMFPEGELTVVTGPTASGKTALLMALLGELTKLDGELIMAKDSTKVDKHGLMHAISYAAQSPWLRHQSIKDNILFGYPYDEQRYHDVIECCALLPDLDILEDGDTTEIGARGVSLSGGQKARVALARAVYAPTKYLLLDDPLSAVDSHTARFLYERLLRGPLLKHRTVVLVTHHVELVLPGTYYIIRMLDGRIDTQGPVGELRAQGVLDDIAHDETAEVAKEEQAVAEAEAKPADDADAEETAPVSTKKPRKLIEEEKRETGSVKWHIYKTYLKASSYWTWGILFGLIVLNQLLAVSEKFWIKYWGEAYGESNSTTSGFYQAKSFYTPEHEIPLDSTFSPLHTYHADYSTTSGVRGWEIDINWPRAQEHPFFYIGVYAAITLGAALVNIIAAATQYTGALRASRVLFKRLLVTVVRATMRWHDVTPQGRMLNRFSKDVETVDTSLAGTLQSVNSSLAVFAASALTVIYVFPLFIFPAVIIGYLYRLLAIGYLNTGRDLRRMESNSRSPIFANFGELLEGIVTVRAFSAEQRFLDDLYRKVDLTTKMWYSFWMTNRWLLLNFDSLGALAVFTTTLFALSGYVNAGLAGVCITSAMAFTNSVYWACRFWTALELDLNSVERVVEYLDLPQEPPTVIEDNRPPAYWPSSTGPNKDSLIVVEDLVVKYAPELPPVLHGVSFSIKSGERIGLLGRTGSGKSTLAMSILRFVDPAEGKIMIDGIDITKIGLHDLRSRITFIPQDATLFSGTLRENLDPFNEHDDSECLDVLYRVQMLTETQLNSQRTSQLPSREPSRPGSIHEGVAPSAPSIASTSSPTATEIESKTTITLDTQVSPGGTNFSQGQRQLIAMARALLRRSSIIVLDEATSSIDFATDAKIQATIREEFNDSLLLTVAHRLRTVIDYDRLLVLDKGELAEFDTPWNLIQKQDGIFRNMCLKSGTFAELEAVAKTKALTLRS